MKIDLVGPERRGLAMGLNEFAGYVAVSLTALATGYLAARYGLRPAPFYLGVGFAVAGLSLSLLAVRDTRRHVIHEARLHQSPIVSASPSVREIFWRTSAKDAGLASLSQAGLVNNLNDGMAWGLFPLLYATAGLSLDQIGWLAAIYPGVWGVGQVFTGALSDRRGRKWLIAGGMGVQAAGIALIAISHQLVGFAVGGVLLGIGTAMVYPTLLAAIGDIAHPSGEPPQWASTACGATSAMRSALYSRDSPRMFSEFGLPYG